MKIYFWTLLLLLSTAQLHSQSLPVFLEQGLTSNRQLQVSQSGHDVALAALEEAKRQRTVRVDLMPTYTLAAGGRTIDVPVGDLLNPVYSSLNALTASNQFPQVENASELLNPNNFYDLKMRASYPILNKSININTALKQQEATIAELQTELYRQELIAEISGAYYEYQMAQRAIAIYEEAQVLIAENLRVNRGLYRQGKAVGIDVRLAQNDSLQLATQLLNAESTAVQAAGYLNFLVNQPLNAIVPTDSSVLDIPSVPESVPTNQRLELQQLDEISILTGQLADLAKAEKNPQVSAFVDVGIQDFDFQVDRQSPYVLAGLALNLNVYDGGQTRSKIAKAQAQIIEVQERRSAAKAQIAVEQLTIRQSLLQSINTCRALEQESTVLREVYEHALQRYQRGAVNYIAVQSARRDLVEAQLQSNIQRYQAWKDLAEYHRAFAK